MLVIIVAAASYFFWRDQSAVQKRNNTSAAQALLIDDETKSFTDLQGNPLTINDSFGKVMVVMSWASWCPQCVTDLQNLGNLAKEYNGRDVVFMAINRAEDRYTAERYLNTMPPLPGELRMILDDSDYYFMHSAGYAMPETIIFTADGAIALQSHGELRTDDIRGTLEGLLKQ